MPLELRKYTSIWEIASLRQDWQRLCAHPNADFDQFRLICRLRENVICPYVIALWHDDECRVIIAGRLEETKLKPTIGYWRPLTIDCITISIITGGVLGELQPDYLESITNCLKSDITNRTADRIHIPNLPIDSPLWETLADSKPSLRKVTCHYSARLNGEADQFLCFMKKKHRYNARRSERLLLESFNNRVKWEWIQVSREDLAKVMEKLEVVAKTTYQRALGAGFKKDTEYSERYDLISGQNQLRVLTLEVEQRIVAFWIGQVYANIFHSEATGYSPEVEEFQVGTLMLKRIFDHLNREGVDSIDYGIGEALYKSRFSDCRYQEATLNLYSKKLRGRSARFLNETLTSLHRALSLLLAKQSCFDRIRASWRKKLKNG